MVEPGGNSHADNHDRDKLRRWQSDLAAVAPDAPAVYAIFLVSEADKAAHDIFRTFRTSFEERFEDREAGFAHLVIFGQHGISATLRRIQAELDLLPEELPTLALFGGDAEDAEYITADVISLPRGGVAHPTPAPAPNCGKPTGGPRCIGRIRCWPARSTMRHQLRPTCLLPLGMTRPTTTWSRKTWTWSKPCFGRRRKWMSQSPPPARPN